MKKHYKHFVELNFILQNQSHTIVEDLILLVAVEMVQVLVREEEATNVKMVPLSNIPIKKNKWIGKKYLDADVENIKKCSVCTLFCHQCSLIVKLPEVMPNDTWLHCLSSKLDCVLKSVIKIVKRHRLAILEKIV